jgi:hypothetical protein
MKCWLEAVILLLLCALAVASPFGCSCGGGIVATGRGVIEAIEAQDAGKTASYFVEDTRETVTLAFEVVFALIDDIKISDIGWEIISETDDTATVEVECNWEATFLDEMRNGHAKEPVDLVKVGSEWLITDLTPFEWLFKELSFLELVSS